MRSRSRARASAVGGARMASRVRSELKIDKGRRIGHCHDADTRERGKHSRIDPVVPPPPRHDLLPVRREDHDQHSQGDAAPVLDVGKRAERKAMQTGHRDEKLARPSESGGAEKGPGGSDRDERYRPGQGRRELTPAVPPPMINRQIEPLQPAPYDEGPTRAMPEAAEQHRDEEIELAPELSTAITSERYIEVVAQKE